MKILFLLEAVTLSHVVRSVKLSSGLASHELVFASTDLPSFVKDDLQKLHECVLIPNGVKPGDFQKSIYLGKPIYTESVIENYIKNDLALIEKYSPDIVVSDFRVSAPVSCKLANVPLLTLANVIWSPYAIQKMQAPENQSLDLMGPTLGAWAMKLLSPLFFKKLYQPMNVVRKKHGLKPLNNLYEMYTAGDYIGYLDPAGLVNTLELPENHKFLGPVTYSVKAAAPEWRQEFLAANHKAVVALGSSGNINNLSTIVDAFDDFPGKVVLATSGRQAPIVTDEKFIVANYIDLDQLLPYADLFVGNGGSSTNYQALMHGVPVIGIPFNLDQYFSMASIEKAGAGILMRSGKLSSHDLKKNIHNLTSSDTFKNSIKNFSNELKTYNSSQLFSEYIHSILGVQADEKKSQLSSAS